MWSMLESVGLGHRLMYVLTSLRCDDYERALISSMAKPVGTLVLLKSVPVVVYCRVNGYSMACCVHFHQVDI